MSILEEITEKKAAGKKQLAVLIDPDKFNGEVAERFISSVAKAKPDYIFVGGSLTASSTDEAIRRIKENTDIKVVLFPCNSTQLSDKADAMLMLSLISGRNADFLIGQHVVAAPFIKKSGI
jgi:putative glycerol-1-phosphate prenyltransferase